FLAATFVGQTGHTTISDENGTKFLSGANPQPTKGRLTMDEKDRLGGKLKEKEKAEEDRYFAERDRKLLAKLKEQRSEAEEAALHQQALMRCPKCGEKLVSLQHHEVTVEECPSCQGMWLDRGQLETLAQRENESWLARFIRRSVIS
ncbi:MAG TPA: zf-TFIIB domain-containing protein, partial [Candidatus Binatia bacterium]|nr:zf-TFIIB domain-containing protein [Candidatus Binatia bacterium]